MEPGLSVFFRSCRRLALWFFPNVPAPGHPVPLNRIDRRGQCVNLRSHNGSPDSPPISRPPRREHILRSLPDFRSSSGRGAQHNLSVRFPHPRWRHPWLDAEYGPLHQLPRDGRQRPHRRHQLHLPNPRRRRQHRLPRLERPRQPHEHVRGKLINCEGRGAPASTPFAFCLTNPSPIQ